MAVLLLICIVSITLTFLLDSSEASNVVDYILISLITNFCMTKHIGDSLLSNIFHLLNFNFLYKLPIVSG